MKTILLPSVSQKALRRGRGSVCPPAHRLASRSGAVVLFAVLVSVALLDGCALQRMAMQAQADDEYRTALQLLVADRPDQEAALEHLRNAAIWDHAGAQKQLGRFYASSGPRPDLVRGYLWLYLASRSDAQAEREMHYLARMMTREQVDRSRALAVRFVPGQAPDELPVPESDRGAARTDAAPGEGEPVKGAAKRRGAGRRRRRFGMW